MKCRTSAPITHVPMAMIAPMRRSGITPRVSTARPTNTAILIKASIARICAGRRAFSSPSDCHNQTDPVPELSCYDAAFWAWEACVKATGIHRLVGGAAAWPADAARQCPDSEVRIIARHTRSEGWFLPGGALASGFGAGVASGCRDRAVCLRPGRCHDLRPGTGRSPRRRWNGVAFQTPRIRMARSRPLADGTAR
jgi:hypothetical protein